MKHNPVVWFEIYVADMARAKAFYEAVFQIQLNALPTPPGDASANGMQMLAFPADMNLGGAGGALVRMEGVPPGPGGTLVYFGCEDCAVEQARVEQAGGRVHQAKFSIGEFGFCALLVDTEGNMVGLHSMK